MEDQVITTAPGAFVTVEQPAHCLGCLGPCSRPEPIRASLSGAVRSGSKADIQIGEHNVR
jgi:hypothetical protein